MSKVSAGITTSIDGYFTGPDDGPGKGLGEGGERLHYWVFGGPWTYDGPRGEMLPDDEAWMEQAMQRLGAVVGGRATYEAARHWGDTNPWGVPFFIVTHRPGEQPLGDHFTFVDGVAEAIQLAKSAAGGGKEVHVMGGGDVIRQALAAGLVDELTIIIAPLILGAGKRLFDGFHHDIELEHLGVRQSRYATFLDYRVVR